MGFGEVESVDLLPGGGDVPVTAANRQQYVELYVRHLLQVVRRKAMRNVCGAGQHVLNRRGLAFVLHCKTINVMILKFGRERARVSLA